MALAIDPLIRMQGISKIFHTEEVETHALSRIDLEVRANDYLAITGPSGCGKSDAALDSGPARLPQRRKLCAGRVSRSRRSPPAQRAKVRSRGDRLTQGIQSHRRPDRRRERRAAPQVPRHPPPRNAWGA